MSLPQGYYDLLERLERPGCAVCSLLLEVSNRFIESLLYEFSLDPGTQRAFRAGRGLCNHHSWQLAGQHGYSLGVAALFEAALDEVLDILQTTPEETLTGRFSRPFGGDARSPVAERLEPEGPCIVCANVEHAEQTYVRTFARHWHRADLQRAYRGSSGLCLPHFRDALRQVETREARRELVAIQIEKWSALRRELNQFQIKSA